MSIVGESEGILDSSGAAAASIARDQAVSKLKKALVFVGYGAGSFGACASIFPTGSLILYFLTDSVGLRVGLATLAIALPKVWDVLVDPSIGTYSDRHSRARGSRFTTLAFAAVALPLTAASVFLFSWSPKAVTTIFVTLLLIAMSTSYTIYWVSHLAAANDIAEAKHISRNGLLVARMVGQSAGGLFAGAVAPLLMSPSAHFPSGFAFMAACLSTIGVLAMAICAATLRKIPTSRVVAASGPRLSMMAACKDALGRPQALGLILSNFTVMIACTYVGNILPYVNKYLLRFADDKLSLLFTALMAAQTAGAAFGAGIAKTMGNRAGFLAASVWLLLAGVAFYSSSIHFTFMLVALGAWGLATGAYTVLLHASILDAAKEDATGAGIAGLLLGLLFAVGKIGDTGGSLLAGASLAGSGGIQSLAENGPAGWILRVWVGTVPASLIAVGIILVIVADRFTTRAARLSNT